VEQGFSLMGSSLESIDLAEDRGRFAKLCRDLDFKIPKSGMAGTYVEAEKIAKEIGFPIICRPSYVLGGRRMEIVETMEELQAYFERHASAIFDARSRPIFPEKSVLNVWSGESRSSCERAGAGVGRGGGGGGVNAGRSIGAAFGCAGGIAFFAVDLSRVRISERAPSSEMAFSGSVSAARYAGVAIASASGVICSSRVFGGFGWLSSRFGTTGLPGSMCFPVSFSTSFANVRI
jgi:hypothetical protein